MKFLLFKTGLKDGLPIGMGYLAVSFSFGIAAVAAGLSPMEALLISMTNLTSAGQFAGIGIIAASGTYLEMAISQLVINLRYALMGISLSQKLDKSFSRLHAIFLGHMTTDEIFAVSISRVRPVTPIYYMGLATLPYIGWSLGTAMGSFFGALLPTDIRLALSVAIYGMFIAIVVPEAKKDFSVLLVSLIAITLSCILYFVPCFKFITSGFAIIICAVIASLAGAIIFPKGDDENE